MWLPGGAMDGVRQRLTGKLLGCAMDGVLRWQRLRAWVTGKLLESTVNSALRRQCPQYVWCVGIRMTWKWLR